MSLRCKCLGVVVACICLQSAAAAALECDGQESCDVAEDVSVLQLKLQKSSEEIATEVGVGQCEYDLPNYTQAEVDADSEKMLECMEAAGKALTCSTTGKEPWLCAKGSYITGIMGNATAGVMPDCEPCAHGCAHCSGGAWDKCLECAEGFLSELPFLVDNESHNVLTCVTECAANYAAENGTCMMTEAAKKQEEEEAKNETGEEDQQDPCAKSPNPAYGVFADPCCESLKGPGCNGQLPVGCAAGGLPQVCRYCFLPGSSLDDGSLPVCKKKDTGVESQQANLIQSEGKDGADGEARVGEPRHGGFNASHGLQLLAGSSAQPRNCDVYRNPQEILRLSTEFKESCFDKIVKLADTICRRYDNALRKAKRSERTLKSIQRITARQNELNKFSRIPGLRNTLLQFANALKRLDAVVRRQLKAVTRARQALERSNSTCARSRSARRNVERVYKRVDRNIDALIANANSILDSNGGLKTSCLDAYCPFFQQVDSIIAECRRKIVVPDFNDNIIPDITLPGSVNNILRELGNILDSLAGLLGTRFTLVNGFCAPEVCVPPICAPEICIPRVCLPFGGPCTGGGCTGGGCTGGGCTPRACTPEVSLSFNDLLNGFDHPLISGAFGFFENLFMGVINGALSALGLGSFDSIIDSIFQQIPGLNINLPTIPEPVLNMDFSFFSTNNLSWPILSPLDGNFATISASIPSSCNSDRVACSDKNAGCAGWAAQGFCSQSSQFYTFMAENCCASCSSGPSPAPPLAPRRL